VPNAAATHQQAKRSWQIGAAPPARETNGSTSLPTTVSPSTGSQRQLLTADDVADILRVRRSFVYALARRGEPPTVRIGERYVRFRAAAPETWIADHESTMRIGTQ
jgi:excisionase family DNA binding protein